MRLSEIAAIAGVSEATVSRVLNRKYGVAQKTRDQVEAALRAVGYERTNKGEIVLILVPSLSGVIFSEMCNEIEEHLSPHGLRALICPVFPGAVYERDYVELMIDKGIAGAIFVSSSNTLRNSDPVAHQLLESRGVPFLTVNGGFADADAPVVSTDDWQAAELSVAHLHDLGHRRIGLVAGPAGNIPADRRVEGFLTAMESRGLDDAEDFVVRGKYSIEGGRTAADELLSLGATAIIASSDDMALGAYRAIGRRGLTVPQDVSVIGYNDSYLLDFTDPPLTSVRQPVESIGEVCTRALVTMIQNRPLRTEEVLLEPELRLRKSTGPVPAQSS
ncbi:LacI family DNA-binding transcriptional regulator [Microbacterium sp. MAH-37]|nr:LacI family DNA-binding transcriptional regulator [Microbacterium sp. MAH-37]MVQ40828.1 LacI family DNA-binding transcriptional regulator [Microbacterium sp. MAH-37]